LHYYRHAEELAHELVEESNLFEVGSGSRLGRGEASVWANA
jgi:hypothetical protein